jgi:predicted membrane protein (TIGR00267 family)
MIRDLTKRLRKIPSYFRQILSDVLYDEHARRAFANNAFDGALTFLGILMGNLILPQFQASAVIKIGLSTCLAIGMSGGFGRYLSERAERKRSLKQMGRDMLTDLSDTSLGRESAGKTLSISLIDGISPALAALIPLAPFFLAEFSVISISVSIVASLVLVGVVLFGLGIFLGKISEENALMYGGVTVIVGFVTSVIILLASICFQ